MPAQEGRMENTSHAFSVRLSFTFIVFALIKDRVTFARENLLPKQGQQLAGGHSRCISRTRQPCPSASFTTCPPKINLVRGWVPLALIRRPNDGSSIRRRKEGQGVIRGRSGSFLFHFAYSFVPTPIRGRIITFLPT